MIATGGWAAVISTALLSGVWGPPAVSTIPEIPVPGLCAASAVAPSTAASEPPTRGAEQVVPLGYYDFQLVGTGQVPGVGRADGVGSVAFEDSPFGVSIAADGSYRYELTLRFPQLRAPGEGVFTVWVTSPDLSRVERKGVLGSDGSVGTVALNKYLVVLTLEPTDDANVTMWSGPIVSRGMSRSGLMHTMAGHGPYETENCAAFGYGG